VPLSTIATPSRRFRSTAGTVATTVSNPYGSLAVRSGQAGGFIRVDGSVGGLLTTGSGGGNDISLFADDIDLIAPSGSVVKSGSWFINVNTFTPGRAIWLGSSGFLAGQLELTDAELNDIGLTRADLYAANAARYGRDPTARLRDIVDARLK